MTVRPSSREYQEGFVDRVNQSMIGRSVWVAVSIYNPAVTPIRSMMGLKSIKKR